MKRIVVLFFVVIAAMCASAQAKYITLSGYLNLSGTVYVPSQNSYASGYVSGSVTLRDGSGYYTNNIYVNSHVSFWASSNYIYTYTYPNTCFSVYNKEGKYVGSGCLNQSIAVSGWLSGNYVYLSGYSNVSVSVNVNEE